MKFGKLEDFTKVDFSLPPDAGGTTRLLYKLPKPETKPKVFVGCTGWSMKEWVGKIYPKGSKPADFLKYYTRQFNTVELNTTHYRIPTDDTIAKWKAESTDDFRFCPKIPQIISHSRDLGYGSGNVIKFCNAVRQLNEKLGCCFMQLPPYFGHQKFLLLEHFITNFPKDIPLAIELRHESWFDDKAVFKQVFDLFEKHGISTVITDVAGRRDVLHQRLTTDMAMIRFVGNNLHPSDYRRIDDWVLRLRHWLHEGVNTAYIFTHEPDNLLAPELAKYTVDQIQKHCFSDVRGPDLNLYQGGEQITLF